MSNRLSRLSLLYNRTLAELFSGTPGFGGGGGVDWFSQYGTMERNARVMTHEAFNSYYGTQTSEAKWQAGKSIGGTVNAKDFGGVVAAYNNGGSFTVNGSSLDILYLSIGAGVEIDANGDPLAGTEAGANIFYYDMIDLGVGLSVFGRAQQGELRGLTASDPNNGLNWTDAAAGIVNIFGGSTDISLYQITKGGKQVSLASKAAYVGAKSFSTKLGVFGMAVSGYDVYDQGLNTSRALDIVMGGVAFIPVVGWAISGTYFISNLVTIGITGQSIGDHLQGAITGQDGTNSWKPWGN